VSSGIVLSVVLLNVVASLMAYSQTETAEDQYDRGIQTLNNLNMVLLGKDRQQNCKDLQNV
jgi:hypothetical protein